MGCDIHFFVERKVDGGWVSCDKWERDDGYVSVKYEDEFYGDRNYSLFAILANVRNGFGFAGTPTGTGFVPISQPRGIPEDVCPEIREVYEDYGRHDHSHSWLTVRELLEYDWTQETTREGILDAVEFWEWERWNREHGESPKSWCGGISGPRIKFISEEQMRALVKPYYDFQDYRKAKDQIETNFGDYRVRCVWKQPYFKCVRGFLSDTMPRLWRLGVPENVRCVFWFDS